VRFPHRADANISGDNFNASPQDLSMPAFMMPTAQKAALLSKKIPQGNIMLVIALPPRKSLVAIPLAFSTIFIFGVVQSFANQIVDTETTRYCENISQSMSSVVIAQVGKTRKTEATGFVAPPATIIRKRLTGTTTSPTEPVNYIRCLPPPR
jgi:hypothetical protein